ncbi:MAG: DUF4105 domain-containing protein [Nitrospira sp.]|nr:MAG: DUF4105 domain-containing protein [Nitrospira sp.]
MLISLFFAHLSSVNAEETKGNPYLAQLISQAVQLQLADEREWHLLLHYRPNLLGGYTSEADDPQFFLSPLGRNDSYAELEGTIRSLFSSEPVGSSKQPAQCSFIARYHWLKDRLAIDETKLPVISCERFDLWINELNAESITLIFASAYLDNPASMFGHTFLRVDQKGQTEQTRILAYTINYAAEVPPNEGVLYPLKGIFGGFKGYFSTPPYYLKVQEYRDIENRDIWEYRLRFSEHQVRRLLEHAWELGNAYFDYFFFKENCSYHILSLLEYADPTLHLTDQFHVWTVPADTVRLVAAQPGLVTETMYRPSRRTVIQRKRERLLGQEHRLFVDITEHVESMKDEALGKLSIQRQAFILDVASDYLRYRSETDKSHAAVYKERNRAVLTARSAIRIPSVEIKIDPFSKQPDLGHSTSRASVGAGWHNNDTFEELSIRAGYHDLLDPEIGHTQDAQVEIGSISLRHYNRADQTRIERATLVNILSLSPMDALSHGPSWKFNVGMNTIRFGSCQLCSNGVLNGGIGASVESYWLKREVYFAFAETEANYSRAYGERHRVGGGGTAGMLADMTEDWRLMATGTYLKYALGEKSDDIRWFVGSRYTLTQNSALRLEYNHRDRDNDVMFSVQAFF